MSELPPLSLYVHVPWCVQKCPYCDFNSHAVKGDIPRTQYVNRLLDDLRSDLSWAQHRPLQSIFIGGGTPSLLDAADIQRLLDGIHAQLPFAENIEITLEANPGTFETERFAGFAKAGVNRLSIGIQSLNPKHLQVLGRIHDPQQAVVAAKHATSLPLHSFNLDLMHGLPGQSVQDAMHDLEQVIALEPPHISWYQLTIEPNTAFASRPPRLPEDDTLWEIQERGEALLRNHGYDNYEVSAFGRDGHRGHHNINYWRFGDYLGIGCGAHSKISQWKSGSGLSITRCEKIKHPQGYLDLTRPLRYRTWQVEASERPFEFFMNYLRLFEPIPFQTFESITGLSSDQIHTSLQSSIQQNLIEVGTDAWTVTKKGRRYLNTILDNLLS